MSLVVFTSSWLANYPKFLFVLDLSHLQIIAALTVVYFVIAQHFYKIYYKRLSLLSRIAGFSLIILFTIIICFVSFQIKVASSSTNQIWYDIAETQTKYHQVKIYIYLEWNNIQNLLICQQSKVAYRQILGTK